MNKKAKRFNINNPELVCKAEGLPEGIIGRVYGIACVLDTPDDIREIFTKGAFDKTRNEKVKAGKVKFFAALNDPSHTYGTRNHIGIVRDIYEEGKNLMMIADIFDTDAGREVYEYLKTIKTAGGDCGLSVGVKVFNQHIKRETIDGKVYTKFAEAILNEITLTTTPAYEGTGILAVKNAPNVDALKSSLELMLSLLPEDVRNEFIADQYNNIESNMSDDEESADEPEAEEAEEIVETVEASKEPEVEDVSKSLMPFEERIRLLAQEGLLA